MSCLHLCSVSMKHGHLGRKLAVSRSLQLLLDVGELNLGVERGLDKEFSKAFANSARLLSAALHLGVEPSAFEDI